MTQTLRIAVIPGDGIGQDVTEAALACADAALGRVGRPALTRVQIDAGAGYFRETGLDIEPQGEIRAGQQDAIFLGAIGLPAIRHADGTEISPHLRLRDRFGLYAGVRPVKAYPNAPQRLADPRAAASLASAPRSAAQPTPAAGNAASSASRTSIALPCASANSSQ